MNAHRMWYSVALLLLAPALTVSATDKDSFGDLLPEGAKARLGTIRGGPTSRFSGAYLLPPKYDTFLVSDTYNLRLHEVATGKVTDVMPPGDRPDTRSIVAASADGKRAVIDRYGSFAVIEVATGKTIQTVRTRSYGSQYPISLSADGKFLTFDERKAGTGTDSKFEIVVWDVDKNAEAARVAVLQNQSVSAVISPDGKALATWGSHYSGTQPLAEDAVRPERVVQVWDVATGKQLAALNDTAPEYGRIAGAAFAPDGKTLAVAAGNGRIVLWEVPGGKQKDTLLGRSAQGARLTFAPDGKTLAAVDRYGAIERWALPDGKPLKMIECPVASARSTGSRYARSVVYPTGLAFADNERVIAWGTFWGRTVAWEAPSGKMLTPVSNHFAEVQSLQFTANGRELISAGHDERIVRWDLTSGAAKVISIPQFEDDFRPISEAQRWLVAPGGNRGLRGPVVYDLETGAEAFKLPASFVVPSPDFTHALAFTPPRDRKATTTAGTIWNLDTRKKVVDLELPGMLDEYRARGGITAAFSPDNSCLITGLIARVAAGAPNEERSALVVTGWNVKTGKKLGEFNDAVPGLMEVAAANNNSGAVFASGSKLWVVDYEKGGRADTIDELGRTGAFACPTFSPDGKLIAVAVPAEKSGEFAVRLYSWPRGKEVHTFTGHRGPVTAFAFSPDGKTLASGSTDTTVLLWDLTKIEKK